MALARGGKGDIALEPSERTPTVFFVRFSDAMADALEQDDAGELTVTLDERAGQQMFRLGTQEFKFSRSKEPIQLDCFKEGDSRMMFVGSTQEKLIVKSVYTTQEMAGYQLKEVERQKTLSDNATMSKGKGVASRQKPAPTASRSSQGHDTAQPLRRRLVQLLAMRPLPLDTISQTLSASRSELQPVLREVANLEGPAYALKQAIFKEVSVNEWPSYTEHERKLVLTNMSKAAAASEAPPSRPTSTTPNMAARNVVLERPKVAPPPPARKRKSDEAPAAADAVKKPKPTMPTTPIAKKPVVAAAASTGSRPSTAKKPTGDSAIETYQEYSAAVERYNELHPKYKALFDKIRDNRVLFTKLKQDLDQAGDEDSAVRKRIKVEYDKRGGERLRRDYDALHEQISNLKKRISDYVAKCDKQQVKPGP